MIPNHNATLSLLELPTELRPIIIHVLVLPQDDAESEWARFDDYTHGERQRSTAIFCTTSSALQ